MAASFTHTYEGAVEFMAAGRKPNWYRPVANATYLSRVDDDTIALVYHETAVVTYLSNGNQIIFTDGWYTKTTKDRISTYSSWKGHLHNVDEGWSLGTVGYTEPDIRTCRTRGSQGEVVRACKGSGTLLSIVRCTGPAGGRWAGQNWCPGGEVCKGSRLVFQEDPDGKEDYKKPMVRQLCEHDQQESHEVCACTHGMFKAHYIEPCEHDQWSSHVTGHREVVCYGCKGSGVQNYGSKPIHKVWQKGSGAILIDAQGEILQEGVPRPIAPARLHPPKSTPYDDWDFESLPVQPFPYMAPEPSTAPVANIGGGLADELLRVLPGLNTVLDCPFCTYSTRETLRTVIIHLNDSHEMSRAAIADWLDTLDVDLTFPAPA